MPKVIPVLPAGYQYAMEELFESELILLRHLFFPSTSDDNVIVNRPQMMVLVRPSVFDKSERLYTIEGTRELILKVGGVRRKVIAKKLSDDFFAFYL